VEQHDEHTSRNVRLKRQKVPCCVVLSPRRLCRCRRRSSLRLLTRRRRLRQPAHRQSAQLVKPIRRGPEPSPSSYASAHEFLALNTELLVAVSVESTPTETCTSWVLSRSQPRAVDSRLSGVTALEYAASATFTGSASREPVAAAPASVGIWPTSRSSSCAGPGWLAPLPASSAGMADCAVR
jgi:hypothetical protein